MVSNIKEELLNQYMELQLRYVVFEKYMKKSVESLLMENGIKFQNISSRIKDINSLKKKLEKESIVDELNGDVRNMYDLCGIRIVLYDNEQTDNIFGLLYKKYNVINHRGNTFDYNANNITIQFKDGVFKNLRCEIQIVTIMNHNILELGHDIIYKDVDELKSKDEEEYKELKEEYGKCLEEVLKLETRVETLKKRKKEILENYNTLNRVCSDEYIESMHTNNSLGGFNGICTDIESIAPYLSRNPDKCSKIIERKIILELTKILVKLENKNFIFSEEFVFDNYVDVIVTYRFLWIDDTEEVLDIIAKFLSKKKNKRMEDSLFNTIKSSVATDISNKDWQLINKIKDWIRKDDNYEIYKVKMINAIINNNIEYAKKTGPKTLSIQTKLIIYNEEGINLIKELFLFACNIFLNNQCKDVYNEIIDVLYKFDFLVEEIQNFFCINYNQIHDIYRYDLYKKLCYSYKEVKINSEFKKKIRKDKFYEIWKYICYDYFDDVVERGNRELIERRAKRKINKYIRNINTISQNEIRRIIKNYNKMQKEKITITYRFKYLLYMIGKKYDKAKNIYVKNKNEYIYIGIRDAGGIVEMRDDKRVLEALSNIFSKRFFDELIGKDDRKLDKDNTICYIITSKFYDKKKYRNELFKIIKNYNQRKEAFLYNHGYINPEFVNTIDNNSCNFILDNYYLCISNKKSIFEFDSNLINLFEVFPEECRKFFNRIIENKRTRKYDIGSLYVYETKNYEKEKVNNILQVIKWIRIYGYYEVYEYIYAMIKKEDSSLIEYLESIVLNTNNEDDLKAIAILVDKLELGINSWKIVRGILLKDVHEEVINWLYIIMQDIGVVASIYQANKTRLEQIKKIRKKEKNAICKRFLDTIIINLQKQIGIDQLSEKKYFYKTQLEDEKYTNNEKEEENS